MKMAILFSDNAYLAHKRLIVIDPDGGKQPMLEHTSYGDYIICYNGQYITRKNFEMS